MYVCICLCMYVFVVTAKEDQQHDLENMPMNFGGFETGGSALTVVKSADYVGIAGSSIVDLKTIEVISEYNRGEAQDNQYIKRRQSKRYSKEEDQERSLGILDLLE